MAEPMLKIDNIDVYYGAIHALKGLSFHVEEGEIVSLIGANGAGKTTLIQALLGEMRHTGRLTFCDPQGRQGRLSIGYVPQSLHIDPNSPVSVLDFCGAMLSSSPVFLKAGRKMRQRVREELSQFGASDLIDRRLCDLSGGELQRVLLAVAVTPAPQLLILDEPVSGIDRNGLQVFYERLTSLKRERDIAILLVSHDFQSVAPYADRMVLLDRTVLCQGTPQEVLGSKEFQDAFSLYVPGRDNQ